MAQAPNKVDGALAIVALVFLCGWVSLVVHLVTDHAKAPRADDLDALHRQIVTDLRLELSKERAARQFPELLEPGSSLARRYNAVLTEWGDNNDERLLTTDFPWLAAREANQRP